MKTKNFDHFKSWCELRELDFKEPLSWELYKNFVRMDLSGYRIRKFKFDKKELASILRMNYGCVPLGCSYESEMEKIILINTIFDSVKKDK